MKKLMDGNEGIVASKEEASKSGESAIKGPREKGRRRGGEEERRGRKQEVRGGKVEEIGF